MGRRMGACLKAGSFQRMQPPALPGLLLPAHEHEPNGCPNAQPAQTACSSVILGALVCNSSKLTQPAVSSSHGGAFLLTSSSWQAAALSIPQMVALPPSHLPTGTTTLRLFFAGSCLPCNPKDANDAAWILAKCNMNVPECQGR